MKHFYTLFTVLFLSFCLTAAAEDTKDDGFVSLFNGKMMCRVDDKLEKEAASKGIIALQMHPGPPMKIEFKDIYIKILPKK